MSDASSRSSHSPPPPPPLPDDGLKDIDVDLPELTTISLSEWYEIWHRLHSDGQLVQRNLFALTGHYTDPVTRTKRRGKLGPHLHALRANHVVSQFCDIDSVIGLVRGQFPIKEDTTLKYFMLLSPTHTLKDNLHIPPVTYTDEDGNLQSTALHLIPNTRFAEMEPQTLVRAFFPRMTKRHSSLKDDLMALFYDEAVQPAAMWCLPEELRNNWPAAYPNEVWRAQNVRATVAEGQAATGVRQQTGREVHGAYVNQWIDRIRHNVNTKPALGWARELFFGVELRGVKKREESMHEAADPDLADHPPDGPDDRRAALVRLLPGFDLEAIDRDHEGWYLDVATTLSVSRGEGRPAKRGN
ncbi:hypothetical protein FRC08_011027 [Ceratobasidium sp. 394]|nr:hypothetical protein FRC08_011027 [Ceratobasidium sp. 394]